MGAFEEFEGKFKQFQEKLPSIMKEKHKDAPPGLRELLTAVVSVGFQYLPYVILKGGSASVSAIRLAVEISKVLD